MKLFYSLFALIIAFGVTHSVQADIKLPSSAAKQMIVVDYNTGQILLKRNADARMPTSSMSKTLTAAVVFDALKSNEVKLDTALPVSEKAWRKGGSKMFVELNSKVAIDDLLRGIIVQSGNDATIVVAEGLSGSEEAFAKRLNAKAQQMGMKNSHFMNASGWPDDNHYSTARDLALMASYIVRDYSDYYHYFSDKEFTYNDITQNNRNPLLYKKMGADGIKTGHTEAGGYGLIGSGVRDGRRVIIVINGLDSQQARAEESETLLEWGLSQFKNRELFSANQIIADLPVALGRNKSVSVIIPNALVVSESKDGSDVIDIKIDYETPLVAPITKGDAIGQAVASLNGDIIQKVDVVAGKTIERSGVFKRSFQRMAIFTKDKIGDAL